MVFLGAIMKKSFVYMITREEDGKKYIGTTVNLTKRIRDHKLTERFKGFQLQFEILNEFDNYHEALSFEEQMIEKHDTFYNGLNLSKNGRGNHLCKTFNTYGLKHSEETKKKIGEKSIERKAWKAPLEKVKNMSSEEYKQYVNKIKLSKEKLFEKRGFIQRKFKEDIIIEFIEGFKSFELQDEKMLFRKNGRHVTKERVYCEQFAKKTNLNPGYLYKILKKEVHSWNQLIEKILGSKY